MTGHLDLIPFMCICALCISTALVYNATYHNLLYPDSELITWQNYSGREFYSIAHRYISSLNNFTAWN